MNTTNAAIGRPLCRLAVAATVACAAALSPSLAAADVEIEYWQYVFDSRVKAMDALIDAFEEENPDIQVKHVTFPYADYQTRVVAAHAAGRGPDVVQLFYGWVDNFVDGGILQPLPADAFPTAGIEEEFFPIVGAMKRNDQYYALPTAVRTMGLFYNKKLFADDDRHGALAGNPGHRRWCCGGSPSPRPGGCGAMAGDRARHW